MAEHLSQKAILEDLGKQSHQTDKEPLYLAEVSLSESRAHQIP